MLIPQDNWRSSLPFRQLVAILIIAISGHALFGNTPLSEWKQTMTNSPSPTASTGTTVTGIARTGSTPQPQHNQEIRQDSSLKTASNTTVYPQSPLKNDNDIDVSINDDDSSGILPLLPWEILTLKHRTQHRRWNLPVHVHSTCAIGSIPKGGRMANPSPHCPSSEEPYQRVYTASRRISSSCDVCAMVDLMSRYNMTLSLWGDSLQLQVSDALHCALERHGYLVQRNSQRLGRTTDKMTNIITLSVHNHHSNHTLTIRYFAQYKPKPDPYQIQKQSLALMQSPPQQPHILFFNFGLHWRSHAKTTYQQIMNATLTALRTSDMFLVFRETTAQHFDTEWGEYPDEGGAKPFVCRPLSNTTTSNRTTITTTTTNSNRTWREDIAKNVATALGYQWVQPEDQFTWSPRTILVAPFRDFVSPYHDLHPDECTHFCYTPHLWIPLWKSLRLAMEKIGEFVESKNTHKNRWNTTNS